MKNKISIITGLLTMFAIVFAQGQSRDVQDFHSVHVSTSITAKLVKSNDTRVEYTMKKGDAKNLITEVKNGRLYVKTKSNKWGWGGNNTSANVTIYYTDLDEIKASAGCSVSSDNVISADEMEIDVSSGSSVRLEVEADEVEVDISSGSSLKLKGSAKRGDFEASSGSTLNAYKFVTQKANVEASSGSSVSIHVDDTLDASASSGASISYTGNVKNKNIDSGWSGSISRGR